jgi:hypothetical protein
MFLWTLGAPQSNRTVKNVFSHSTETVSRKFNDVLHSVTLLAAQIIKPKDPQFRTGILGYKKLGFGLISRIILVQLMDPIFL